MGASKNPRIVDVLLVIAAELRLANQIHALRLGSSALDAVDVKTAKTDATRARVRRNNKLRAAIRAGLELEEVSRG